MNYLAIARPVGRRRRKEAINRRAPQIHDAALLRLLLGARVVPYSVVAGPRGRDAALDPIRRHRSANRLHQPPFGLLNWVYTPIVKFLAGDPTSTDDRLVQRIGKCNFPIA